MSKLEDFRLEVHLGKWEFAARWHMTASDAESMTLSDLLALANAEDRREWDELPLRYVEPRGTEALRAAIARTYARCAPEDVLCFAGAEEGLYCAMHAILEPSDHAVVVTPGYQASEEVPRSLCATTGIGLREDRGWELDLDELASKLRPETKLVAINFPHNPTGTVLSADAFDALARMCTERGIWLFSDEVYRGLELDEAKRLPAAVDAAPRGLSLGVMSKAYGLPGLRVGWIAARDRTLLAKMERVKHYLSICNAGPSEHLAVIALKAGDRILERNRGILAGNLEAANQFFAAFPETFEYRPPEGGCVAFPRYRGAGGVETFCRRMIEEEGVVLLPASIFASQLTATPNERFRIGLGRSFVGAGLSVMRGWLERTGHG
jgi:aspartate/methionine/tyrosine aminotransferase